MRIRTWPMGQVEVQFRQLPQQGLWFSNLLLPLLRREKMGGHTKASRANIFINHPRAHWQDLLQKHGLSEMVAGLNTNTSPRKSKQMAPMDSCRFRNPLSFLKGHRRIQIEMNWRKSKYLMASKVRSTSGLRLSILVKEMAQTLAAQKSALLRTLQQTI